ncbi:MAG: hypothetical protein VB063_11215 [Bacteroides graminisolvens]|nr:hypothetical protein [Bacteroides graminisolvens]
MKSKKLYNLIIKSGSLKHDAEALGDTPQKAFVNLRKIFKLRLFLINNKDVIHNPVHRPIDQGFARQERRRKLKLAFKNKIVKLPEYPHLREFENE